MYVGPRHLTLNHFVKATTYGLPCNLAPQFPLKQIPPKVEKDSSMLSLQSKSRFNKWLPTGVVNVSSSFIRPTQYRCAHSDIRVPDFSKFRRASTADPTSKPSETADSRRAFTYLFTAGALVMTEEAVKVQLTKLAMIFWLTPDALAAGQSEINVSKLKEGQSVTFKWRGKPLFIKRRTQEEIEDVRGVNIAELRDPARDEDRVQDPEWLVTLGVCTHLGCVPLHNSGDFKGGYFCPCHGSHYDASGRVRKGPAPLNLEVPPYSIADKDTIVVGA